MHETCQLVPQEPGNHLAYSFFVRPEWCRPRGADRAGARPLPARARGGRRRLSVAVLCSTTISRQALCNSSVLCSTDVEATTEFN